VLDEYVAELSDWLRIPSVSADPVHAADVRRAGAWVCEYLRAAGGEASLLDTDVHPLAVGELQASSAPERAPTVLLYGHFDVQPPAPVELWDSPPFEPTRTADHVVARGAVDDKGGLYMLLRAAAELARTGELPVNVRVVADGEEEIAGPSVVDWVADDERRADACLVFDTGMARPDEPAFVIGTRGALAYELKVRTAQRDLHSGIGNTVLNAVHVTMDMLGAVLPRNGRLPEPLRVGVGSPTEAERASWKRLKSGDEWLAELGALPHDGQALEEFHHRTSFEPSLDVNGIVAGKPGLVNTTVPATAQANFVFRVAPGQDVEAFAAEVERLLRQAAPAGTEVELVRQAMAAPGATRADEPAVRLAADAFERVLGARPLYVRVGGTLPILSALAARRIPAIVTGFGLPDSNAHAPNERLRLDYLPLGIEAARETLTAFAELRRN
jgi:acetylornithine deacetylase/succinyl-diaminopimelate desuccinylase-like protein